MDNKYAEHFIIIQSSIEANRKYMRANTQDSDDKMRKFIEEFKTMITAITYHINNLKYLPTQKDSPNPMEPTMVNPYNRRAPPLDSGHSTKIGGM